MIINMPFRTHANPTASSSAPRNVTVTILGESEVDRLVEPVYAAWSDSSASVAEVMEALTIDLNNAIMRGDTARASMVQSSIASIQALAK